MPERFIIDQRSASLTPSSDDVRDWAAGRRVFVSSLITDMPAERAAVRAAIESIGAVPVMFERDLGGQDITAEDAYLSGVRSSDIYIGLFGTRYGIRMPDGYSATQAEFMEAERQGLRLCLFVHGEASGDMDGSQRDLIAGARNLYVTGGWAVAEDLRENVVRRLTDLAAEELAPWVRLGRALFRATTITSNGTNVSLEATVRGGDVHAELMRLRDNHSGDLPFASPSESLQVRVDSVTSSTLSTASFRERLVLSGRESRSSTMRMSINSLSPDEVAKRSLADGLFDTSTLGEASFGSRPADPLAALKGAGLDDSIIRAVSRLLITEHLLNTDSASTVDHFALGPSHSGVRRLRVTWTPKTPYMNEPDPDQITIDGEVREL